MTDRLDFNQNHFDLFGLPVSFALDTDRLEQAYRDIQSQIHPDRFAHAGVAEQRLSMQWATRVNEAYQALRRPFGRARYLLQLNGIDAFAAGNAAMTPAFLIQQMEWREALEEARSGRDPAALQVLSRQLREQTAALQASLATQIDEHHALAAAAETLRELRFMDKLLEEIDAAFDDIA